MAFFASSSTVGWAQLPPIQPKNSPSDVIIALSPGSPEVGRSLRTTVARANGTLWANNSPAFSKIRLFIYLYRDYHLQFRSEHPLLAEV